MRLAPSSLILAVLFLASAPSWAQDPEPLPAETDVEAMTDSLDSESEAQGLLPLEDLRTFTRVYDHIRTSYVEELTDTELLEYAIKGMMAELDPHSSYLDADRFEDLQVNTSGEFGGLGIEVGMENGFVKVVSPIDDTPAKEAGIEAGDLIIRLDDQPVKGMSLNEAVSVMRGPKGSEMTLTIVREGVDQPFELSIVRDIIKVRSVRTKLLDDDYLYVRIATFQVNTGRDLAGKINRTLEDHDGLRGVILDLRNNPGGVLQASVDVTDIFLDGGLVVYTEGRIAQSESRYHANAGDVTDGLPLVVLINDGSASASEIVAGALQDQGRAVIMGTRSFGKGSVQTVVPITESRAIKLTTARYYTPNGRSIQAQGIEPDVIVERAKVTAVKPSLRTTEADLAGHLNNGNGEEEVGTKAREESRAGDSSILAKDNQLHEALNLLKGLHIFRQQAQIPPVSEPVEAAPETDSL
ncbi:S41 family peptidase [Gilvimarinus agarilyticus]|uniref:S41 family peptidase n=1 Tax=Gilvimarinus sp. 2_MG-2023 TaxID=3062666 RepID=UPI001C08A6A4|nr:S41 family peptidase [Gilvimarinus sp. 2_MG-2023]MBU2885800.1 S41 family peptidase [Gilvimarinus agarilyticus]MDO6570654.1 S41 family peptidase [Gilvimarinus sp. 2_MG-2023]